MKQAKLLLSALFVFVGVTLFAQNVTVSGTVTDASTGEPMPAASVVLLGSTRTGTVTDIDGAYSLNVPVGATLAFSSIGYKTEHRTFMILTLPSKVSRISCCWFLGTTAEAR